MTETHWAATGLDPDDIPDKTLGQLFDVLRNVHRITRQQIGQVQFTPSTLKTAAANGELTGVKIDGRRCYSTNDGLLWVAKRKSRITRARIESALERRRVAAQTELERQRIEADRQDALAALAELDAALAQIDV